MTSAASRDIDDYLATLTTDKRAALQALRRTIRAAVPSAEERISYGVPAFSLDGRFLVAFAAAAKHCSFFPGSAPIEVHAHELKEYSTSKGTIRFTPDRPLPAALVRKLLKERQAAIARAAAKPTAGRATVGAVRPAGAAATRFPPAVVRRLAASKVLGVRAGSGPHRFIATWVVVARGRVFIRSWELRPDGWFHTFRADPVGRIQVGSRTMPVRARLIRSEAILQAVDAAYAEKYSTPGARKYVQGLRRGRRRASTTELLPG